jgi:amino acid transporter
LSFRTLSGGLVTVGRLLKSGGEGEIYAVTAPRGLVLKKYKPQALVREPALEAKLHAMTTSPPAEWQEAASGHVTLAWPTQVVRENGRFAGFLMPAVDTDTSVELHQVTNPSDRRAATGKSAWRRGFTWAYQVSTAANLARATHVLHTSGSVIGDFNERNILVTSQARVTLIDCDSMQFTASGGRVYFCRVGRPEFTPPELLNADWTRTFRHPSSDLFALAIHIYQLLMEGEHPFRGAWSGTGEKPPVSDLAVTGTWAFERRGKLGPRPTAIDVGLLPDSIRDMFRQAFENGAISPARRPTALQWQQALTPLLGRLRTCRADREHRYPPHHGSSCPWCEHQRQRATAATTTLSAAPLIPGAPLTPAVPVFPAARLVPTPASRASAARPAPVAPPTAPPPRQPPVGQSAWPAAGPSPGPAAAASLSDAGLTRATGRSRLFMMSAGSIFGSSWLLGAGYAEQLAGPASLLAWVIGGAAALVLALVTAELSAMFPVAGGLARFPAQAFGGVVGAAFGWTAWLQAAAITAFEVVTAGILLDQAAPNRWLAELARAGVGQSTLRGYTSAVVLAAAFTALNFCGIGAASRLNSALTWVKLATMGLAVAVLLAHFDKFNLTHAPGGLVPYGPHSVFSAVGGGGIMFAYLGFEQAGQLAGEARNSRRDIPWAIIAPVILAAIVYVLLQVSFIGAIPAGDLARGWGSVPASVIDLARDHNIANGQLEILRAAPFIGVLGTALAYAVTAPRLAYGLGRSGLAPASLARTSRGGVPWAALIATFAASLVLLLPGVTWQQIVGDLTSASALMYAGTPLCLGAFREQFPAQPRPYRLPAARVLGPVAFIVASLIIYWCGWQVDWRVGVALIVGTVVLLSVRRPTSLNLKAVGWLAAYLAGLGLIARIGQYGGTGALPMWWDMAIITIFSLLIHRWAIRTRL